MLYEDTKLFWNEHRLQVVPSVSFDNVFVYYDGQLRSLPRKLSVPQITSFIADHPKLIKAAFDISISKKSYTK